MFRCADSLLINGSMEDVYKVLYDVEEWPKFLPHVKKAVLLETKGEVQVICMTTVTNGKEATMKSMRVCTPFHAIKYEQLEPHPLLNFHKGEWRLADNGGKVRVQTTHEADIKPEAVKDFFGDIPRDEAEAIVRKNLLKHSLTTLQAIKERIESKAPGSGIKTPRRGV